MTAAGIVEAVRADLRAAADPSRAAGQQAYMKSAMPFLGVRVPDARRIARMHARADGVDDVLVASSVLWAQARFREERYAAMALLADCRLRGDERLVAPVERMIREGAWWDVTDELAHRVAELHDARPAPTAALVRAWSTDDDKWIRRSAIISQLGRGDRVDAGLLAEVIEHNAADPDFFIRKAIGWALREYARVQPDRVRRLVAAHPLSALSVREATKHL